MSEFVDTNIFVRLLTRDDLEKAERCLALFERANQGELQLVTSEAVIAETVYVLASPGIYGTPREAISISLSTLIAQSGLRLDHKEAILEALELYGSTRLHFIDCLCVAHTRREGPPQLVYSYDRELDRIPGIQRREP